MIAHSASVRSCRPCILNLPLFGRLNHIRAEKKIPFPFMSTRPRHVELKSLQALVMKLDWGEADGFLHDGGRRASRSRHRLATVPSPVPLAPGTSRCDVGLTIQVLLPGQWHLLSDRELEHCPTRATICRFRRLPVQHGLDWALLCRRSTASCTNTA